MDKLFRFKCVLLILKYNYYLPGLIIKPWSIWLVKYSSLLTGVSSVTFGCTELDISDFESADCKGSGGF